MLRGSNAGPLRLQGYARDVKLYHIRRVLEATADVIPHSLENCASLLNEGPRGFSNLSVPTSATLKYTSNRELGLPVKRGSLSMYSTRKLPALWREKEIDVGAINKIFASQWLSDDQVVFTTKCNRLFVLNLKTQQLAQIECITGEMTLESSECLSGIHTLAINSPRTVLATGGIYTNDVAFYKLPTFDPLCVGEKGHSDWMFDMCWLDDELLLSGSRDGLMSLWRVNPDNIKTHSLYKAIACNRLPYEMISPYMVKKCRKAGQVRAIAYNEHVGEAVVLGLNSCLHMWDIPTFKPYGMILVRNMKESVCMKFLEEHNHYVVGSQSNITFVDTRCMRRSYSVCSKQPGQGVRSLAYRSNLLSIGTAAGGLFFFDIRAQKYMQFNCGHALSLSLSRGYINEVERANTPGFNNQYNHPNAVYTQQYDSSFSRLFVGGGPLSVDVSGNYAAIWH